ncbi:MAG: NUDIX hydrolase [Candidatus Andersenbacteria bacterium]
MLTCTFEDGGEGKLRHAVAQAVVVKNDQILLEKRAETLLEGGKWALPGGYVDHNETIEQAITREIREETGWEITNLKLLSIFDNPDRPNDAGRQNIAFNYACEATEQTGELDWEVSEIQWFNIADLPPPDTIAFDHYMVIQQYIADV